MRNSFTRSIFDRRGLLFVALLCLAFQVGATNYYVDAANGNDSNDGRSTATAFKTISAAAATMADSDVCLIAGGVYREMVTVTGNNMTFRPSGDGLVIVTGTEKVDNWVSAGNGIYRADMSGVPMDDRGVTQILFNKQRMEIARYPNNTSDNLLTFTAGVGSINGDFNQINSSQIRESGVNWTGAKVWMQGKSYWWASAGSVITNSSGDRINFPGMVNLKPYDKGRFFIYNTLKALDVDKEWFYDDSNNARTVYFKAPGGVNPSEGAELRVRELGFDVSGSGNTFSGLYLYAATFSVDGARNKITNAKIFYPTPFFDQWSGIVRENHPVDDRASGVRLAGTGNTIENSEIAYSWGDGVTLGGEGNTVRNCRIHDVGWRATEAAAVYTRGNKHLVQNNVMYNLGRSGVVHRRSWDMKILNNDIYHYGYLTNDLGGTYAFETDGGQNIGHDRPNDSTDFGPTIAKTEIAYNWIHDTRNGFTSSSSFAKEGLYIDNRSYNIIMHHNAVWNLPDGAGFRVNYTARYQGIYNNTFWNTRGSLVYDHHRFRCCKSEGVNHPGQLQDQQFINNLFSASSDYEEGYKSDIRNDNALVYLDNYKLPNNRFVNASGGNFQLVSGSEAINKGRNISGITEASDGRPDVGAYEFGDTWTAGLVDDVSETTLPEWFGEDPTSPEDPDPEVGEINVEISALYQGSATKLELADQDDVVLASWDINSTAFKTYTAQIGAFEGTTLKFLFDGVGDLRVDYLKVGEERYETEDQPENTAVWTPADGCDAVQGSDYLHCPGYVLFENIIVTPPKTTSEITINANGDIGSEDMVVIVNGTITREYTDLSTSAENYTFTVETPVVSSLRIEFPASGPTEENLTVDYAKIDERVYQTEVQADQEGSWTALNACQNNMGATLHCPGYVNYDLLAAPSLTIAPFEPVTPEYKLYPNPTNGIVSVEGEGAFEVVITDFNGRIVLEQHVREQTRLDVSQFSGGVYWIALTSEGSRTVRKLIVK